MAKLYAQIVGVVLIIIGVLGFFVKNLLGLPTTTVFNLFHLVAGAWGAYAGFSGGLGGPRTYARIFPFIPTVVGVLGFVAPSVINNLGIPSSVPYNIFHLILGLWGLWAGYLAKEPAAA